MELVYLWVEKYKNIEKQGFNFSPMFTCSYNETTNKLTIDEKKDYVSIFPENINVTAIVGENGSGKSSIFEVFSTILTLDNGLDEFNYFYVLNNGSDNICYSNNINILNEDIAIEKNISRQIVDGKLNHEEKNYSVALKKHFDASYLNISHLERDGIIKNDSPSSEDLIKYYGIYKKNDFNLHKKNPLYSTFSGFKLSQFNLFQTFAIGNLLTDEKYKNLFFKTFKIQQPYSIKIDYIEESLEKIKVNNTPNGDIPGAKDASVPNKIDDILNFLKKIDGYLIIESEDYNVFFILISSVYHLEKEFQLTFHTKDNKPIKLSSGEKTILFYLERMDFMLSEIKNKSNILLFDEIELYLHPTWQKKILNIIFNLIQENKLTQNLHIILASHSPFILSDLPKENIIFLEKDENGNCNNATEETNIETFGANIHTLLSHGFFMKDGLMGEFAKGKINEVIDNLQEKSYSLSQTQIKSIIKTIGEPFLQTKLKQMYNEKFGLTDELEELQKEQEKINKKIKELKKQKSEDAKS